MTNYMGLEEMQAQALEQLKWLSTDGGLTITAIGERMRTPRGTVSRWLNGHKRPVAMACALIEIIYKERRREKGLEN